MTIELTNHTDDDLTYSTIAIDNPPLNVLDLEHCRELVSCLHEVHADDRARVVILRGAGTAFSAGVDIKQHTPEHMPELLPAFHDVFDALLQLRAISVAAVHGHCLGGGAELAFACDRVIAESTARIGFPEIEVGCYPPVALCLLPYRANHGAAVEMIIGGAEIDLDRFVGWGMVHGVADAGKLDAAIEEELGRYRGKSPEVSALAAALLHEEERRTWGDRIRYFEQEYLECLLPHPDVAEGIAAFNEKRKPVWKQPDALVSPDDELF